MKKLITLFMLALATTTAKAESIEQAMDCMTEAIYYEARNQPWRGQVAVGHVIMNRVKSKRFPNTVCGVVRQQAQFSYYWDGKPERQANKHAKQIANGAARTAFFGHTRDFTGGSTHYFASWIKRPYWAKKTVPMLRIGEHIFHKEV